jgi:hypothetical protein
MDQYQVVLLKILHNPLIQANMMMSVQDVKALAEDDPDLAGWVSELCLSCKEAMELVGGEVLGQLIQSGTTAVN